MWEIPAGLTKRRYIPAQARFTEITSQPLVPAVSLKKDATLKTRRHSSGKPEEWKDFVRDMDLWIMVYDALTYLARHKLMGALALKAHIQNSEAAYKEILNDRELSFFTEVLAAKTREYDPDDRLNELLGKVVCVELNPQSYLREKYGADTICGKFIRLNAGKAVTRIKSEERGSYGQREAAFSFRMAYPDGDHLVDISLLDLVNLEPFD